MSHSTKKSSVSPPRHELIDLMRRLHFGRINGLAVEDREPVLNEFSEVLSEVRFGSEETPVQKPKSADFTLRRQVVELFEAFDRIGTGRIEFLEIRHGLPFRMRIVETVSL